MKTTTRSLSVLAVAALLVGCGGGGNNGATRTGTLALQVIWPKRSRLIPAASLSIKAVLTRGAQALGEKLIVAPDGEVPPNPSLVTFDNLLPGTVTLTATAYPNSDGTGVAQATGAAPATIVSDQTATVSVTMASTIDHIDLTPANPSIPFDGSVTLTATPRDIGGNVVLVQSSNIHWVSASPDKATLGSTIGLANEVLGKAAGTSLISLTETESGKGANTTVTVTTAGPPPNTGPNSSALDQTGNYLYVADNHSNTVSQFKINANGTLSPLSPATVSVALPPYSIVANPAPGSNTLYVGASNSNNGAIYGFTINPDGTLTPLSPSTPPSTSQPITLLIHKSGKFLFSIDHNEGIRQFIINTDGTLTQNGPDVTDAGQLFSAALTQDGNYMYTSGGPREYRINTDGTLSFIGLGPSASGGAQGMSIDWGNNYLYVTYSTVGAGGVDIYKLQGDGSLTKAGPSVQFSQFAYKCTMTHDNRTLYVVALNTPDNEVAQFRINGDGTLTPLSPATVSAGSYTTSVTVSGNSAYLYVTNLKDNTISQFRANDDGTLTPLSPPAVPG